MTYGEKWPSITEAVMTDESIIHYCVVTWVLQLLVSSEAQFFFSTNSLGYTEEDIIVSHHCHFQTGGSWNK